MDKGQLTTDIVTFVVPVLFAVNTYVSANPGPLEEYLGAFWSGLIIAVMGAIVANYMNPRQNEDSYYAGYSQGYRDSKF